MKNIKENQLKKCIFMTFDEFKSVIEEITTGLCTVEYEYGVYLVDTDIALETYTTWEENILETLSKHFDVEVTSYHSDSCDVIGVWICYR